MVELENITCGFAFEKEKNVPIMLTPRPTEGGGSESLQDQGHGQLGFCSVISICPAAGAPASPLAVGINISSPPGLLWVGPWNRLSLEVMLMGSFAGQEKAGHLSSCPQGDVLFLQTQVLICFCFCSWVSMDILILDSILFWLFPTHGLLILCKLSILTTLCLAVSYLLVRCRHNNHD